MKTHTFCAARLQEARGTLGVSRNEMVRRLFARGLQISQQTLVNWEAGRHSPDAADLPILAQTLGKPVAWFYVADTRDDA